MEIKWRQHSKDSGISVSHFWISSINVPQREMLLNILVAYKWLHLYINSPLKKKKKENKLAVRDSKELA